MSGKVKHVPMRTCIGTGQKFPKREMVRLICTDEGRVVVDPTGKRSGSRGAYVSKSYAAAEAAIRHKKLQAEFERAILPEDSEAILVFFKQFEKINLTGES